VDGRHKSAVLFSGTKDLQAGSGSSLGFCSSLLLLLVGMFGLKVRFSHPFLALYAL
jgi:hypothetical protein